MKIKVADVVFREDLYPRIETSAVTVQKYAEDLEVLPPIIVNQLRFDVHPDSFEPKPFRRHHLTSEIVEAEITPLGFEVEKLIVKRS